jgi:hypothetical protein
MTATKTNPIPLVVTTLHKGVFFGHGIPTQEKTIVLEKAQMCVYWSADVRGVFGLAATGPNNGCKISPPVPEMTIQDITAIAKATPEAVEAWEKAGARKWA